MAGSSSAASPFPGSSRMDAGDVPCVLLPLALNEPSPALRLLALSDCLLRKLKMLRHAVFSPGERLLLNSSHRTRCRVTPGHFQAAMNRLVQHTGVAAIWNVHCV